MTINERNIRINATEGHVDKNLSDLLKVIKEGPKNLEVNLKIGGDTDILKSFNNVKIEPQINITSQLEKAEVEFEAFRKRLSQPININVSTGGSSGINTVAGSLQNIVNQTQQATKAGQNLSQTYTQVGQNVSATVRNMQRSLDSLNRSQSQAQSSAFRTTNTIGGLPVRGFTKDELAAGASTRLDQRLLLRGLDQARIIPGNITRQTQISPSAAASEYIRQEKDIERLAQKKAQLEQKLQDKLNDEAIRAEERRQSSLQSIARKASSQNIDIRTLKSSDQGTAALLGEVGNVQKALNIDPLNQAKQIVANAAKANKIAKEEFESKIGIKEFFSTSAVERQNERLGRVQDIVDRHPNIPGLQERLKQEATSGKLPSRFDLGRLKDPAVATQVAFGAVFGGAKGATSAAVGGAIGGVPGALAAATIQQAAGALLDPVLHAIEDKKEKFVEAGSAYEGSILSISAALQQSTEILGPSGKPLGSTSIKAQLDFQEREATKIQLKAREGLLPEGIGGSTEATFVRGTVAALGQRGINGSADEIAEITRIIGGIIQTQRPQLLENTSLLNRDLQDVLSGQPQANRTILGSLIRTSLPKLAKATSGKDIVAALQNQSAFADVAVNSTNPVAVQNKLKGAEDQLNTLGGEAFLKAQSFGLQVQTNVLKTKDLQQSSENLGRALGTIDGALHIVDASVKSLGADLINVSAEGFSQAGQAIHSLLFGVRELTSIPGLGKLGFSTGHDLNQLEETNKQVSQADRIIEETQAIKARSTATGRINSGLEGVGLIDSIEKFGTERTQSSTNKLSQLDKLERLFSDSDRFKELAPGIFNERINAIGAQGKERASIFSGSEGELQTSRLQREDVIPEQLKAASKLTSAAGERIESALKRAEEANKSTAEISNELEKEESALRSAKQNRITNPPTNVVEDAQSSQEIATIKSRIDDLKIDRKEKAIGVNQGDSEIQNLTDQLIEAGRKELSLKDEVVAAGQKETEVILSRLSKISAAFDIGTQAGAVEEASRSLKELNKAADSTANVIAGLSEELDNVAKVKDVAVTARQKTSDPGVRAERDKQIKDLSRKEDELKQRRQTALDEQAANKGRINAKNLQSADSINTPIRNQIALQDQFTFRGQTNAADLTIKENDNTARIRAAEIQRQQALLQANPNNTTAKSAVERLTQEKSLAEQQRDVIQPRNKKITGFETDIARIDLSTTLRKSQRAIEDEQAKRRDLNSTLEQSAVKLKNFSSDLQVSKISQEGNLVSIADQIRQINPGAVPESLGGATGFDEDTTNRLKVATLAAQGNQISRKLTGNNLFPQPEGLGLSTGVDFDKEARAEQDKLKKGVRDTTIELADLTDAFKKAKLEFQKEIFVLNEKIKGSNEGTAKTPNVPVSTPQTISNPQISTSGGGSGKLNVAAPTTSTGLSIPAYASSSNIPVPKSTGSGLTKPPEAPGSVPPSRSFDSSVPPPPTADSVPLTGGELFAPNYKSFGKQGKPGELVPAPKPDYASIREQLLNLSEAEDQKSLTFNALDAPLRDIDEPVLKKRLKGSKTFISSLGPDEGPRHAQLRQDIGVDLASAFTGTKERVGPFTPQPDVANSGLSGAIFGAVSGTNLYPQKEFVHGASLANTQLPVSRRPQIPDAPSSDVRAAAASAASTKSLETQINALKQQVASLTTQGLKLSAESVSALGSQISSVFHN